MRRDKKSRALHADRRRSSGREDEARYRRIRRINRTIQQQHGHFVGNFWILHFRLLLTIFMEAFSTGDVAETESVSNVDNNNVTLSIDAAGKILGKGTTYNPIYP